VKVTADDIAQLLAGAPPRRVPVHVVKAAQGGKGSWVPILFGLVFGGMGLVFTVVFFPWRFVDDWRLAASEFTAAGKIRSVGETNMSINDTKVQEYVFAYTPPEGAKQVSSCYTTGLRWREGEAVTVRYLPGHPDIACIDGARLSQGGAAGVLVGLFPLIGGGLVGWSIMGRRKTARLLAGGRVAEVDVRAVDATRMQVNYQTLYKITLSPLPGGDGQPVIVKRWAKPEVNLLTQRALDKQSLFVLYDPRKPKNLIFPEALIEP
jgi:hypothetical protein